MKGKLIGIERRTKFNKETGEMKKSSVLFIEHLRPIIPTMNTTASGVKCEDIWTMMDTEGLQVGKYYDFEMETVTYKDKTDVKLVDVCEIQPPAVKA